MEHLLANYSIVYVGSKGAPTMHKILAPGMEAGFFVLGIFWFLAVLSRMPHSVSAPNSKTSLGSPLTLLLTLELTPAHG